MRTLRKLTEALKRLIDSGRCEKCGPGVTDTCYECWKSDQW